MSKELIRLRDLCMAFDDELVLDNINLYINDSEFLTLLGPSGCGKTTTLRIIGGFTTPTSGDVTFDGVRINDVPPHKRQINTVFQKYALFPHLDVFENIARALERGQQKKLLTLCQQALDEGCGPGDILSKGMIVGMNRLGEAFSANRAFVPEMLMAARCMSAATELLKPLMVGEGTEPVGRVCLGTVKGDMHDIGKNLVRIMMEGSGIEVSDLGVDTSAEQFVSTAVENHCGVIACSSLLTTTMEEMREVVKLVHERGLQDQIKVMVGGAPISQSFCDEIGADYYAEDAGAAAREAVKILKVQKAS